MPNQPRNRRAGEKPEESKPRRSGILGALRPVELLAIGVIGLALVLYALSKCGKSEPTGDNPDVVVTENNAGTATAPGATAGDSAVLRTTTMPTAQLRPLYVILDSIKLRRGPHLDSGMIQILRFGEEVYDMGKRTDFEQTIKISVSESRTAPWVLIRTAQNKEGWVFGAGLEFYRKGRIGGNPTIDLPATVTVTEPNAATASTPTTATTVTGGR